jgi:hypothetical protein
MEYFDTKIVEIGQARGKLWPLSPGLNSFQG